MSIVYSSVRCTEPDSTIACVELTTGVNSLQNSVSNLQIYPNPNTGTFTVSGTNFSDDVRIEIFNEMGQVVYNEDVKTKSGILNQQIALEGHPAEAYMLIIRTENENIIKRIIINP